jgi:very-short-patch-repair endonuclease
MIGHPPLYGLVYSKSRIRQFAAANKRNPTNAERRFGQILMRLNGGVLRGRFRTQHPISGKWIVDFFFPEVRLAIELDGGHHGRGGQAERDRIKEKDCRRFDITLVRSTNAEVFRNPAALVEKLRGAWAAAGARKYVIVGKDVRP